MKVYALLTTTKKTKQSQSKALDPPESCHLANLMKIEFQLNDICHSNICHTYRF